MFVTRADELDALAERVEKLTAAHREVDRHVHWVGLMRYRHLEGDNFLNPETGLASCFKVGGSPKYTSSIDTAMTLVPEGGSFVLNCFDVTTSPRVQKAHAHVSSVKINGEWHAGWLADAATPALALTAACLRAQASIIREAGQP